MNAMRAILPCLLLLPSCSKGPGTDDAGPSGGDGGSPTDGAGAADSAGGADMTAGKAGLYPLAVGYRWTYEVKSVGAGSVCAAGSFDAKVVGTQSIGGKDAFATTSFCSGISGNTYVAAEGERVLAYYNTTWMPFIDTPIEDGHTWSYFNTSYTWKAEGTITVPAGAFTGCWTAKQNVTYTAYQTYCRGVGLVRSYSSDLAGNGWDAKLQGKSF